MNRYFSYLVALALTAMFAIDAQAQCSRGTCSSRNATLGEQISQLPAPVIAPAPAPAPQIAYTAPSTSSYTSNYTSTTTTMPGNLVVAGYTYPQPQPAPQLAYITTPVQTGATTTATTTVTAPALVGASTQLACQNGGCGGRRFQLLGRFRGRGETFQRSVAVTRTRS